LAADRKHWRSLVAALCVIPHEEDQESNSAYIHENSSSEAQQTKSFGVIINGNKQVIIEAWKYRRNLW